jgi:hypothetical protein
MIVRNALNNAVFRDVMPHGFGKNRHVGLTYRLHNQGEKNQRARNNVNSIVTANVVPSSLRRMEELLLSVIESAHISDVRQTEILAASF